MGPLEGVSLRRDRATAGYQRICFFRSFFCSICFKGHAQCGALNLVQATRAGWARLTPQQRERFFQAGLKAALRLDRLKFRAWLLRRVRNPPLAAPIDPARFSISDADLAILLKAALEAPGKVAAARRTGTRPMTVRFLTGIDCPKYGPNCRIPDDPPTWLSDRVC